MDRTETEIQQLESQVEQVESVLQEIAGEVARITEGIARLERQGDEEVSEALGANLKEKQEKEVAARQEVTRLTAELDNAQSRLTETQTQNDQSRMEIEALEGIGEDVGGALSEVSERDAILRLQGQQIRMLRERLGSLVPAETKLYEPRSIPPISERVKWVDEGIKPVFVSELPPPDGIQGTEDFHKISEQEMKAGILRLQEMQPAIASGTGANSDYWAAYDTAHSLEYAVGYQRVYDAFYGNDAIKVNFDGEKYDIINGRHRIWLAQGMGIDFLPMRVTGKVETQ
jgi:hypothetical protein